MIKQLKKIPILVFILSIISYSCVFIPPRSFWPAGLLTYAIPVLIIINICLIIPLILTKSKKIIWPVLSLAFGYYFIDVSYNFPRDIENNIAGKTFTVMSFNAKLFRQPNTYSRFSEKMINWVVSDDTDIKCIQEYSFNNEWENLNITQKITEEDYYSFVYTGNIPTADHNPGLAIFSRYPIINKDSIIFNKNSINNCIYADLQVNGDVLRVYNVHLYSMSIPLYKFKNPNNIYYRIKGLLFKLKKGSIKRNQELDILINHTEKCPYPFIICGDFNEIPYGYNYRKLREQFLNSFEYAGQGFGFSTNNKPLFLRIDHQFVNNQLEPIMYFVDNDMRISDHFPVKCIYKLH